MPTFQAPVEVSDSLSGSTPITGTIIGNPAIGDPELGPVSGVIQASSIQLYTYPGPNGGQQTISLLGPDQSISAGSISTPGFVAGAGGVTLNQGANLTVIQGSLTVQDQTGSFAFSVAQSPATGAMTVTFVSGGPGASLSADGSGTLQLGGSMQVNGDILLPAADCAEEFDVAAAEEIDPGTVMVLGDDGALYISKIAYDKKVAGVVSGAGKFRPGMILDRRDSSGRRLPIGLVGKVYCKADARYGQIEVGDMLTTSPTPGHAMKAVDPAKAFGCVLGKALGPLSQGRGLIPMLISLQ